MKWLKRLIRRIPNKLIGGLIAILLIAYIAINSYFIYTITLFDNIENFLRYITIIITIIIFILMFLYFFNVLFKNKLFSYILFIFILLTICLLECILIFNINKLFSAMNNMNKEFVTYSTSLVTLKDNKINTLTDIKNIKIGIINDKDSIEGYIISKDIIAESNLDSNNEIIEYDDFVYMLNDLYEGKVDAIFLSSNYHIMFSSIEHFHNIIDETKIITTKEKKLVKQDAINQTKVKKVTESFTILIMGVDSTHDGLEKNAAFNGDALMLVTLNPMTLNATLLTIPRDTYVPIMCFKDKVENKITHAAWYGESCMIRTIENFTGIKIDYYTKINFKGVVKLVDALGGIDVDVPIKFCEQNSDRAWGKHEICLNKGKQVINGEQALALARHRSTLIIGDIQRGGHQQLIISGIISKIKEINSLNQMYKIMDSISNNIDTNLTTNQILGFYNVGKDMMLKSKNNTDGDIITIQRLYLSGYDKIIWDEGMRLPLYNYMYYRASLKEIVDAMKINLGIKSPELIKKFNFSINNIYTPKIIGKGSYKVDYIIQTTPDFTKNSKAYSINWGKENDIRINFVTIDSSSPYYKDSYKNDEIIHQSIPYAYRVSNIDKETGITLKIVKKSITPIPINCSLEENSDNPSCLLPNMIDWSLTKFNNWASNTPGSFMINKVVLGVSNPLYDITKAGLIYEQSKPAGTKIIDIAELTVKYYESKSDTSPMEEQE